MRVVRGSSRQRPHSWRGSCATHSAAGDRPPAAGAIFLAASCATARGGARVNFHDEPVPGYPLPILPGHTSPGRLERVLRAGQFAVTSELAPPDSADPEDVYRR